MTGEQLREYLLREGYMLKEVAVKSGMTQQALNSKLNTKEVTIEFAITIAAAINKSVYHLIEEVLTGKVSDSVNSGLLQKIMQQSENMISLQTATIMNLNIQLQEYRLRIEQLEKEIDKMKVAKVKN
jgi:transcriptional regulator with XRE-family HTH domain